MLVKIIVIIFRKFDELDVGLSSKRAVIGTTRLSRQVLPDGPYIVKTYSGNLHPICRLISDPCSMLYIGAFLRG